MRVAVLADIHGNLPALLAVLAEPDVAAADRVVLLGDIALGPLPAELQNHTVVTVGVGTAARDPEAGRAFLKFLTATPATSLMKSKGFEPIPK